MSTPKAQAIAEMHAHMKKCGGDYSDWYCGITKDIKQRLFQAHSVEKGKNAYIYRTTESDEDARQIEVHFLDKGCKGDTGGGDEDSTIVYAYKIASNTVE